MTRFLQPFDAFYSRGSSLIGPWLGSSTQAKHAELPHTLTERGASCGSPGPVSATLTLINLPEEMRRSLIGDQRVKWLSTIVSRFDAGVQGLLLLTCSPEISSVRG
ncbi:hypothetical protein MPLDJ20_220038 [Mesorhizobium plurifarium]|uniref:Uncharacterized protein n=1 Tax=Mesorhizobium plurifarium TaxID=69974 RepID=A0A090F8R1_MESPL|nr:hypothetical protein MPLDJ20_220038 [Mesorhizobium plurifarium]